MEIETTLKINFRETLSDSFDDETRFKDMDSSIEQHIQDWYEEHKIAREFVEVIK